MIGGVESAIIMVGELWKPDVRMGQVGWAARWDGQVLKHWLPPSVPLSLHSLPLCLSFPSPVLGMELSILYMLVKSSTTEPRPSSSLADSRRVLCHRAIPIVFFLF